MITCQSLILLMKYWLSVEIFLCSWLTYIRQNMILNYDVYMFFNIDEKIKFMILLPLYWVQIQNPYFGSELNIFHMIVSLTVFFKCSSSFISHLHKRERIFKIDRYLDVWQKFSQRILNNSRPVVWIFYQIVWLIYCRLCIFLL